MAKAVKTIQVNIPRDDAKMMHERIYVFIDLYHEQQRFESRLLHDNTAPKFDIKALCYSCYMQGLADAKEAIESQK